MSLSEAIKKTPPPPCEKYHCKFKELCAKEELACESFYKYIASSSGRSVSPFKKWEKNPYGKTKIPVSYPDMEPSMEWFDKSFKDE